MCGRFNLRTPMTVLAEQFLFDLDSLAGQAFRPRYNIAPTQSIPAVRLDAGGKWELALLHWGFLVLADGYYEWERSGKVKLPWLYEVDGGRPFAFAGLWESWQPEGADAALESCTTIITDANEVASQVHDRMPVILVADDYDGWLAGEQIPLIPFPADRMSVRPVSTFCEQCTERGAGMCREAEVNALNGAA